MKPNQMPKKPSKTRQQLLSSLIERKPASWAKKVLSKDEEGKETVETVNVQFDALRYPLAQNVSEQNVEAASRRWM